MSAGDSGQALTMPDNPRLRQALAENDPAGASEALRTGTVLVPTLLVDGVPTVAVMRGQDGQRTVLAFTGPEPMARWAPADGGQRAGAVRGSEIADLATEQRVSAVVLDAAGPTPVSTTLEQLRHLVAGTDRQVTETGSMSVGPAEGPLAERLRAALATFAASQELWLFTRVTAGTAVLTVGLCSADPRDADALADVLARLVPPGAAVDLAVLDEVTRDHLATQLPGAHIGPAAPGGHR